MKKQFILLLTVLMLSLIITACGGDDKDKNSEKNAATEAATEYTVTPASDTEAESFRDSLIGTWSSYTKDGIAYTYTFSDDGKVSYTRDDQSDPESYSYTFENGLLTITRGDEKRFVYQCSKDAVGMIAKLAYGQTRQIYAEAGEEIEDFNGYAYISDDFLYLGTVCMCREESIKGYENDTLLGNWIGAVGDTINFAKDGSYAYLNNGEEYYGTYSVDYDKKELVIKIGENTTDYDSETWSLDGRVFRIGSQYYFKYSD